MQRKTFPSSSACCFPDGVSSPPHLRISNKDASLGASEKYDIENYIEIVDDVENNVIQILMAVWSHADEENTITDITLV